MTIGTALRKPPPNALAMIAATPGPGTRTTMA